MSFDPRHQSRIQLEGHERAPARAMLRGIGFTWEEIEVLTNRGAIGPRAAGAAAGE